MGVYMYECVGYGVWVFICMSVWGYGVCVFICMSVWGYSQARTQGGFEGVRTNPPFGWSVC